MQLLCDFGACRAEGLWEFGVSDLRVWGLGFMGREFVTTHQKPCSNFHLYGTAQSFLAGVVETPKAKARMHSAKATAIGVQPSNARTIPEPLAPNLNPTTSTMYNSEQSRCAARFCEAKACRRVLPSGVWLWALQFQGLSASKVLGPSGECGL